MSGKDVESPFWTGGFKELLEGIDAAEERDIREIQAALERNPSRETMRKLLEEREQVRARYAEQRRRAHVEQGLSLFVGD